ncbi:MAG: hypothetical protein PF542_04550 [Nanoarchaeota archaeon]|nr:hypothetical protein [Nanoarchaeota archaeon]
METLHKTIKQTAKRYALPAIVVGSLALGSCSNKEANYLPINENLSNKLKTEQRAYLDSVSREAGKDLELAVESFNQGIADKIYTVKEMTETLSHYNKADSLYDAGKDFAKEIGMDYETMPKDAKHVQGELEKVVNGIDFGQAKVENKLNKSGINVDVENPQTKMEANMAITGIASFLIGLGLLYHLKRHKE